MSTKKFVFEEFSKDKVINNASYDEEAQKGNDKKNFDDELIDLSEESESETQETIAKEQDPSTPPTADQESPIEVIDIETIKQEAFEQAAAKAKEELKSQIEQLQSDKSLLELLKKKLSNLTIEDHYIENIVSLMRSIVKEIAYKLHKELPTNFEQLFNDHILSIIANNSKMGQVNIKINPVRGQKVQELLKLNELSEELSKRIKVTEDDNLNTDDCQVSWQDGQLEYKTEDIIKEIDKILNITTKAKEVTMAEE